MNELNMNEVVEVAGEEVGYYYNNAQNQVNQYDPRAAQNQPKKMPTQLNEDEYALLMNHHEKGFTDITPEDLARAKCPHRSKNGQNAFMADDEGNCSCSICGTKFQLVTDTGYVHTSIRGIKDALNTIKVFYRYIPEEVLVTYTQFMPLLDNLAKLYDRAIKESEYSMMDPNMTNQYLYNDRRTAFNAFSDIMTSGYTNVPGYSPQQGFGYAPQAYNVAPPVQYDQYGQPVQMQPQYDQYGNNIAYQQPVAQTVPPTGNGWGWNGMPTQQPVDAPPVGATNSYQWGGAPTQQPVEGATPWNSNVPANTGIDTNMNK